jgi:hypothetical protein
MAAWGHSSWVGVKYFFMFGLPVAGLAGLAALLYRMFGPPALYVAGFSALFFIVTAMVAHVEFYEGAKEKLRKEQRTLEESEYVEK